MTTYKDIRAAFEVQLATTEGTPSVAYPNVGFKPTTGNPYLMIKVIPTDRRPAYKGVGAKQRYLGLAQIILHFPEGEGSAETQDCADLILSRFESNTDLTYTNSNDETVVVHISRSQQMGSYEESPWFKTPINVYWYAYF